MPPFLLQLPPQVLWFFKCTHPVCFSHHINPHKPFGHESPKGLWKAIQDVSYLLCNGQEQQNTAPAEMWFLVSQEGLGTGEVNSCGEVVGTEPIHTQSHGFLASLGQGSSTLLNRKWLTKENVRMIQIVAEGGKHLGTFHKHEHDRGISLHSITRRPRQGDTSDWSSGEIY